MLKTEFESGIEKNVSDEEYEMVNTVYMYYPLFGDKEMVYSLFNKFGLTIFRDMYPRARRIADLEMKISAIQKEIEELKTREVKLYGT